MVNTLPRSQWTNEHHYWVWKQQQDLMARLRASASAAALFLAAYGPYGMVLNFDGDASISINDAADVLDFNSSGQVSSGALLGPGSKLTYTAPSLKLTEQADGFIKFQAHNLCLWSEDFSGSNWTKSAALTRTLTQTDPRGGNTAALCTGFAGGFQAINPGTGASVLVGATYTFEIWLKGNGTVTLDWNGWSGATTVTTTSTWTKFSNTAVAATSTAVPRVISYGGNTATDVYVAFAHIRRTPSASDYIKTTTAAAYDLPYVYSSGVRTGITVEPAATNVTFPSIPSAAEAAAAYSGSTIFGVSTYPTIAAGSLVAPISGAPTIRLTWNGVVARYGTPTSATSKHVADSGARSVVTSVYARAVSGTVSNVSLVQRQTTGGPIGSVTPTLTETWQRIAKVSTTVGGNGGCGWYLESSGTGVIEIVQYDHCVDTVATSPIITYGSTVLRAADTPNALLNLFPAIGTAYTIYAKYKPQSASVATTAIRLDDTTANELVSLGNNASGQGLATVTDGGAAQAAITSGTITASAFHRVAASVEGNNVRFVVNGGAEVQDTSVTLPTLTRLLLTAGGGMELAQLAILPGARTEAQLQALGA